MIAAIGWIGAVAMVAASFLMTMTLGKILAIFGLLLLTIQARHNRQNNLIALNLSSIIGFSYSLMQVL
tara:strand:- start:1114 stop:1317 length:204 start_codon:yes stop_codon:yes gene_type:complete